MKETILVTALLEGGAMFEGREIDGIEVTYAIPVIDGNEDEELDFHNAIVKDPLYKGFTSYRVTRVRRVRSRD